MRNLIIKTTTAIVLVLVLMMGGRVESKSIILANYHNILLFFPKELGGNDDLRVIYDVRNSSISTFKYMPVVVSVAYDSEQNQAYAYLESAVTSYIIMLKWAGGRWCHQVLFDFPASQFSKYMYHSLVLMENFIYWTTDRFIMSGRIPGYEKRLLLQPAWNRLYSMTPDKTNQVLYVSAFDYTENALFRCSLRLFSCMKLLTPEFPINYISFNKFDQSLYIATIQPPRTDTGGSDDSDASSDEDTQVSNHHLYRYREDMNTLVAVESVESEVSNMIFLDEKRSIVTNQQSIVVVSDITTPNASRRAHEHLIDPYALQYVFTFNQVVSFDNYPYPYVFSDYHDLLYRNSLYMFYVYACGMDLVDNDLPFLPQMDMNSQFLKLEDCQTVFYQDRDLFLVPTLIFGSIVVLGMVSILTVCFWRSRQKLLRTIRQTKKGGVKKPLRRKKLKNLSSNDRSLSIIVSSGNSSPVNCLEIASISEEISARSLKQQQQQFASLFGSYGDFSSGHLKLMNSSSSPSYLTSIDCFDLSTSPQPHADLKSSSMMSSCEKLPTPTTATTMSTSEYSTSTSQRVKFDDYKTTHFFYDCNDDDDDDDNETTGNKNETFTPSHFKIYNQDEFPKTGRKSKSKKSNDESFINRKKMLGKFHYETTTKPKVENQYCSSREQIFPNNLSIIKALTQAQSENSYENHHRESHVVI